MFVKESKLRVEEESSRARGLTLSAFNVGIEEDKDLASCCLGTEHSCPNETLTFGCAHNLHLAQGVHVELQWPLQVILRTKRRQMNSYTAEVMSLPKASLFTEF